MLQKVRISKQYKAGTWLYMAAQGLQVYCRGSASVLWRAGNVRLPKTLRACNFVHMAYKYSVQGLLVWVITRVQPVAHSYEKV